MALSEKRCLREPGRSGHNPRAYLVVLGPVVVFCLYAATLCPQIFLRDAPEFVATSQTLSISHPAGSPTYNLYTNGFTFLPAGSAAFRVHLASAVCGALAVFFMILVMKELFLMLHKEEPDGRQVWGMILCALLFGVSLSFWKFSITAEVYTLQDFLFVVVLWLGFRFYRTSDVRLFFTGAFIYGLSLGAHIVNTLFSLPFLVLGLSRKGSLRHLGIVAFLFVMGFSVYLYLPFRFERAPIKLGYTVNNLEQTAGHITVKAVMGKKKEKYARAAGLRELYGMRASQYVKKLVGQVSYLGFVLGLGGVVILIIRQPFLAIITMAMSFLYGLSFYNWKPFGLFPVYILWTIWAAVAVNELLRVSTLVQSKSALPRRRALSVIFSSLLLCGLFSQVCMNVWKNLSEDDLSDYYISRDLGAHLLDSLDYGASLLTRYSIPHFLIYYLQGVEGYRTDVHAKHLSIFVNEGHVQSHISKKLREDIPVFMVGNDKISTFHEQLVPHGTVFRFMRTSLPLDEMDLSKHREYRLLLEKRLHGDRYQDELETYQELFKINTELHRYYWLKGRQDIEEQELRLLTDVNPTSPILNMFWGITLFQTGKYEEARAALMRCQEHLEKLKGRLYSREKRYLYYNAGVMALRSNEHPLAEYFLKEAMGLDPTDEIIRYYLAITLFNQGKLEEARRQARVAYKLNPREDNGQLLNRIEETISQLKRRFAE